MISHHSSSTGQDHDISAPGQAAPGGHEPEPDAGPASDAAAVVRRVVAQLDRLEPTTARYLAGLAFILTRVADADHIIGTEETRRIEEILNEYANLPEAEAVLVAEIARQRQHYADCACSYEVSRELRASATAQQRRSMLRYIFAVAMADGTLSANERTAILQIASELGFDRDEVAAVQASLDRSTASTSPDSSGSQPT